MSETVQDIFDGLSSEQKDVAALIFGAIASNDPALGGDTPVSGDRTVSQIYETLTPLQKDVLDFIAAGIEPEVAHGDVVEEFLAHFGVKGMRWGARKDGLSGSSQNTAAGRAAARAKVKGNSATLEEAHLAGLKSTGHRVANGVLGDKTFWKRTAITAGVTALGIGTSMVAPALLPADIVQNIGVHAMAASGAGLKEGMLRVGDYALTSTQTATLAGAQTIKSVGGAIAVSLSGIAGAANAASNLSRAVRGNARIDKSYAALGAHMKAHQAMGSQRVNKILRKNGGIKIKHDDLDGSLEHRLEAGTVSGGGSSENAKKAVSGKKGGSGKFDESKVKRDGHGQFAKKAGTDQSIDLMWLENFKNNKDSIPVSVFMDLYDKGLGDLLEKTAKERGIKVEEVPPTPELLDFINKKSVKVDGVVSPSGTQRVVFSKGPGVSIASRVVPYHGPNPHPEVTATLKKQARESARIGRQDAKQGPMFNPNATIDNSQVQWKRKPDFSHEDVVGDFLAHFGVKGMRWGIRRKRGEDGTVTGDAPKGYGKAKITDHGDGTVSFPGVKDLEKKPVGSTITVREHDGSERTLVKRSDGRWENAKDTHLSADAERTLRTMTKQAHEMSDREMREAINRANMVKQYNDLFTPGQNSELQAKVAALRLQQEYGKLQAEMNPSAMQRVGRLMQTASKGYDAFEKINKKSNGQLGIALAQGLGLQSKYQGKHVKGKKGP